MLRKIKGNYYWYKGNSYIRKARFYERLIYLIIRKITFKKSLKDYNIITYKIRKQIKNRDKICQSCFNQENKILSIHHIDGNTANNSLDNLILLCKYCHLKKHNKVKI